MIDVVFEALVHASVQASLLIVLLMLARFVLGDRIPAGVYCSGWVVAGLRLVIPFTVHTPLGLPTTGIATGWVMSVSPAAATTTAAATTPGATAFNWTVLAGAVWLLGTVVVAAIVVVRIRRSARQLATTGTPTDSELLAAWAQVRIGLRRPPGLVLSDRVDTPLVAGILRPRIVIPYRLQGRLDARQWESVLLHELAHLRRGDLVQAVLWAVGVALHWPNPLVWGGAALYRRDRELAADARAVTGMGGDRLGYGRALLRVMEIARPRRRPPFTFVAAIGPQEIRRRIVVLANQRPPRWIHALATVTLGVLAVVTLSDPRWVTSVIRNGGLEDAGTSDRAPPGWFMSGGHASEYRADSDSNPHRGKLSARLLPRSPGSGRYATLMQHISADRFRGRTVRVSAFVRGEAIDGRGDFWARVQAPDSPADGPGFGAGTCRLTGTFDWLRCEVVLEVPNVESYLQFGVGLGANGTVWVDDASVEVLAG